MNKEDKTTQDQSAGFKKNGQTKVFKNSEEQFVKLANPSEKEYGIDDLVKDSEKEGGDNANSSRD